MEIPDNTYNASLFTFPLTGTLPWALPTPTPRQPPASATPRHDGVPNLLKYAFHMDLGDPDTHVVTDIDDFWERVVLQQNFDPRTDGRTFLRAVVRLP